MSPGKQSLAVSLEAQPNRWAELMRVSPRPVSTLRFMAGVAKHPACHDGAKWFHAVMVATTGELAGRSISRGGASVAGVKLASVVALAACSAHAAVPATTLVLHPAADRTNPAAAEKLAASTQAITALDLDAAKADLDAVDKTGPLGHDANVKLWEQRGIVAAYVDDVAGAKAAFDMLLALDPGHFLSYYVSPKATFVFEELRNQKDRTPPALDVQWQRGGKVGDPVPLDLSVVADPKQFLRRATVFVRMRGEPSWRAADIPLHGDERVVLPPVAAQKPVSLELYVRAYDDRGNEVLTWADPARPREIALRYDPPPPWYRTWWAITIASSVVALGTGIVVYEETVAPPDKVTGSASVAP